MIISIASGKGGTGKTTVATNLALSMDRTVQFLDCDVEEPNAHIFLKPQIEQRKSVGIPVPEVNEEKCTHCGKCQEICAFNAIAVIKNKVLIFPELCHGCGGCSLLCPEKAIREVDKEIGIIQIGKVGPIEFINGKLNVGEAMSPPLIRTVKKSIANGKIAIIDAPPGTSCPVIESIKNSDFCILVTESTPFGLNDLILAVEVVKKLEIPFGVIINRFDIGDDKVDLYCKENEIPILMLIPFDMEIASLYSRGIPMVQEKKEYTTKFLDMFKLIENLRQQKAKEK